MSDITKRLRQPLEGYPHGSVQSKLWHEAADQIEKLEAQLERYDRWWTAAEKKLAAVRKELLTEQAQLDELEAQVEAVRECQTYVVDLDDCEQTWFKKEDVLKALDGDRQ